MDNIEANVFITNIYDIIRKISKYLMTGFKSPS